MADGKDDYGGDEGKGEDDEDLDPIERGRRIFLEETFDGNGRTCGTCHPAENNFALIPVFNATLPPRDPLFSAEFNSELKENFEKPELMREFGLILENVDGFGDLENKFAMRGAGPSKLIHVDGPDPLHSIQGRPQLLGQYLNVRFPKH